VRMFPCDECAYSMDNSLMGGGSLRPTDLAGQVEKVGGKDRVI
jgi:hypothetical protein